MSKTTTDLGAEPTLRGRLTRAAAASGGLPPFVFPGAAALILPVSLPVKTARQRRAALPFAVEPYLAEPVEQAALALGPQLASGDWLCVAANRDRLRDMTAGTHAPGPVLPDTLAVPLPNRADAWAVWCGPQSTHLRMADGTGMATTPDHFPDLWRVFGAPPIELKYGAPPPGTATTHEPEALPALDPALLQIDLRGDDGRGQAHWV
ncbi:MAG: type II secretion system protein GspL, partial [Pseudomonadota bacterium]